MTDIIKTFSEQAVANTTPNTFNSARLLRVTNLGTVPALVTITSNTVNTSVALLGNNYLTIEKLPTDLLSTNTTTSNVVATVIAYKN